MSLPRTAALLCALLAVSAARADSPGVVYQGGDGPGRGKHIVLVAGDEEYRSEEAIPQLARILARHHGFKCTVLLPIDRKDGTINPTQTDNIPGLEALKTADLAVFFLRFRNLPDDQMRHIVDYVEAGKPVIGLRTATHAFNLPGKSKYAHWHWPKRAGSAARRRRDAGRPSAAPTGRRARRNHRPGRSDHLIVRGTWATATSGGRATSTPSTSPLPGDSKPLRFRLCGRGGSRITDPP
ncbi:MAG: hypothetical protein U0736_18545 [Gemmataceae bacterium]